MIEQRLEDSNYDHLTQSTKSKDNKNMNDVSIADATVDNKNDTNIDTDNDTSIKKIIWDDHSLQSTHGNLNGIQQINYGDDDHKTDVSKSITSVNKTYKYYSYKDACNGNTITHGSNTITHGDTPTTTPLVSSE